MAEHIWTVLCERHLVDPASKVISLMDVRESLMVEGLDQLLEEAASQGKKGALVDVTTQLVSWWFRSDSTEKGFQARFVLVSPAGENLLEQIMLAEWSGENNFVRIFVNLTNFPVPMAGLYWFVVEQQKASTRKKPLWESITRIPLHVTDAKDVA